MPQPSARTVRHLECERAVACKPVPVLGNLPLWKNKRASLEGRLSELDKFLMMYGKAIKERSNTHGREKEAEREMGEED